MYNIYNDIETEIIDSINPIINEYLQGRSFGTNHAKNVINRNDYDSYFDGHKKTILDAKKDFNKRKNIIQLIKDIQYVGKRNFMEFEDGSTSEKELKYFEFVKKILNDIITDKIALQKDNKIMELKNFDKYFKLYEIKLPTMRIDEIIENVKPIKNNTLKSVLVTYYKTYDDYIDLIDNKKHLFKIHDMIGDIMNNNRVSFDVCIFEKEDLDEIKNNLIDFAIGEFHNELPNSLNIFGVDIKPSSFINKDELRTVFDGVFTNDEIINIISSILTYKFDGQFNNFFLFSNKIAL
jgi:hypothetical protein